MSRRTLRRSLGGLILVAMALSAAYGGGFFGLRDRFPPPASRTPASPFGSPVDPDAAARPARYRRSQPYWREVARFSGTGPATTPPVAIDPRALQWRVAWRCQRGDFRIQPRRPGAEAHGHRLADATCPAQGRGTSVARGRFQLEVGSAGPWQARVEQQLDVPLVEPPIPEMTARGTRMVARGEFYDIDEDGLGRVEVYRHRSGSLSLRLEDFYVTPNVDLEIRFSELERPRTTKEIARAPFENVVFLKATTGSMNYRLPPDAFGPRVRSVVIWCELTHNAYAAASLRT